MLYRKIRRWIVICNWKGQIIYHRRWTGNDVKRKYFLSVYIYILHKDMPALNSNSNNVINFAEFFLEICFFKFYTFCLIDPVYWIFSRFMYKNCKRVTYPYDTTIPRKVSSSGKCVSALFHDAGQTFVRASCSVRMWKKKTPKKLTVITRNIIIEILLYRWTTHIIRME